MGKKIRIIIGVIQNNWNNVPRIVNLFKSTFFSKKTKINYLPIGADIEPTIACNLDCIMCHQKELLAKRKSISMSFDNFKKIIDKLPTLVKINLQGMGEPFANKDFVSMVEYSKKKKIYVTTITNGLLLDKNKIKEIVSSGLDRIYFSIDTTDKEKYQFYRGKKGDLEKLIANLEELIKERKLQNKKYLEIGIWMLLFENNIDQLFPMVKMAKKIGVDKLTAQTELTYRGKSNWKENIEKIRFKKNESNSAEIKKALGFAKKIKFKLEIQSGRGFLKPNEKSLCLWPFKSIYITSEGDVVSCCVVSDPKISKMGNILEDKIETIWNNNNYQNLRKSILEEKIPYFCKGCYGKN